MGETIPPEWPRFMFHADGRSQQFASQEEVDATGETWYRTPQEAQQAQQQASPPPPPVTPPPPDDEDEGSPGADRPHTPRSRR
jgi:hypothetical protein